MEMLLILRKTQRIPMRCLELRFKLIGIRFTNNTERLVSLKRIKKRAQKTRPSALFRI